jgi:hypothetical protein
MSAKKCNGCGIVNFASDLECRRCGQFLSPKPPAKVERESVSPFFVYRLVKWVIGAAFLVVVYFAPSCLEDSKKTPAATMIPVANVSPAQPALSLPKTTLEKNMDKANFEMDKLKEEWRQNEAAKPKNEEMMRQKMTEIIREHNEWVYKQNEGLDRIRQARHP